MLSFEKFLEEASLAVQGAANACSCGEHKQMMDVFDVIEGGRVVAAAAGIVTALRSCRCDEAREFLRDALQVVVQLGETRGEREHLLHMERVAVMIAHARGDHAQPSDVPSSAPPSQPPNVIFPPGVPSSQPSS